MSDGIEALWDWRRRIAGLYAAVRAAGEPAAGWRLWREERDRLFREHSQSPIEEPAGFGTLPFWDYDPALRFAVRLRSADGAALRCRRGRMGTCGCVRSRRRPGWRRRWGAS